MNDIAALLKCATSKLEVVSDTARLDAEILLSACLKKPRSYLYSHCDELIEDSQLNQFNAYIDKRLQRIPIAYILGHKEFWSLEFEVNRHTLIPRPETELLVELTLKLLANNPEANVLELGTGCGAIAIALAHEQPNWRITASDISPKAIEVAKRNTLKNHTHNIEFIQSDWFSAMPQQRYDAIISNPPYIEANCNYLADEVICHEPTTALISQDKGYKDLKHIIKHSVDYLHSEGLLILEHGFKQQRQLMKFMQENQFEFVQLHHDLAKHPRAITGKLKKLKL